MQKNLQIKELLKFLAAGVLNTAIDFIVLNMLLYVFGFGAGSSHYALFKVISFSLAVTNSFFLNKLWVFKNQTNSSEIQTNQVIKFLTVSLVGLVLNILTSSFVFHVGPTLYSLDARVWANIGALTGTLVVFVWNYFGYKLLVFKSADSKMTVN